MFPPPLRLLAAAATLLAIGAAAPASAQWRVEPVLPLESAEPLAEPATLALDSILPAHQELVALSLAGMLGAAVGTAGGAYLGYHLDRGVFHFDCERGCEDPGLWGFIGGWFLGSALTTPLAVHLTNGRSGSLSEAYVASALVGAAAMGSAFALGSPWAAVAFLGAPAAQVVAAVVTERSTAR